MTKPTLTQSMANSMAQMYAKQIELHMNPPYILGKMRKPKPLTRSQKIKQYLSWLHPMSVLDFGGEKLTRRLMKRYDIYEGGEDW